MVDNDDLPVAWLEDFANEDGAGEELDSLLDSIDMMLQYLPEEAYLKPLYRALQAVCRIIRSPQDEGEEQIDQVVDNWNTIGRFIIPLIRNDELEKPEEVEFWAAVRSTVRDAIIFELRDGHGNILVLRKCLKTCAHFCQIEATATTTAGSNLTTVLCDFLDDGHDDTQLLGYAMASLASLALFPSAATILAARSIYRVCEKYIGLCRETDDDAKCYLGIQAVLLLFRTYGKEEESGSGPDCLLANIIFARQLLWLLDKVLDANYNSVLEHVWDPDALMHTVLLVVTADRNKQYLIDAVPVAAKALVQQDEHPNLKLTKAALGTLAQLIFEPLAKPRLEGCRRELTRGLDLTEPLMRETNDLVALKEIGMLRSALAQASNSPPEELDSTPHGQWQSRVSASSSSSFVFINNCNFHLDSHHRHHQQLLALELLDALLQQGYQARLCTGHDDESLIAEAVAGIVIFPDPGLIYTWIPLTLHDFVRRIQMRDYVANQLWNTGQLLECPERWWYMSDSLEKTMFFEMSSNDDLNGVLPEISDVLDCVIGVDSSPDVLEDETLQHDAEEDPEMLDLIGSLISRMSLMQDEICQLKGDIDTLRGSVHQDD